MNHPSREEFVPYLFGETKTGSSRRLKEHLRCCPECRSEVERWRRSLGRLDGWKLPRSARRVGILGPLLRWVAAPAALAVLLALAFVSGRLSGPGQSVAEAREAIAAELRQEMRQELARSVEQRLARAEAAVVQKAGEEARELLAAYSLAAESKRAEEIRVMNSAIEQLEARWQDQRIADYLALKKELDTVAVNTDAGLRQLADGAQSNPARKISTRN